MFLNQYRLINRTKSFVGCMLLVRFTNFWSFQPIHFSLCSVHKALKLPRVLLKIDWSTRFWKRVIEIYLLSILFYNHDTYPSQFSQDNLYCNFFPLICLLNPICFRSKVAYEMNYYHYELSKQYPTVLEVLIPKVYYNSFQKSKKTRTLRRGSFQPTIIIKTHCMIFKHIHETVVI